jgi:hypothetical protein
VKDRKILSFARDPYHHAAYSHGYHFDRAQNERKRNLDLDDREISGCEISILENL